MHTSSFCEVRSPVYALCFHVISLFYILQQNFVICFLLSHVFSCKCDSKTISLHAMKAYRGRRGLACMCVPTHPHTPFVITAIDASDWAASCHSPFIPRVRAPGTFVGPRASLDILEKTKTSCLCWESNCSSSSLQPSHYSDPAMLAPVFSCTTCNSCMNIRHL